MPEREKVFIGGVWSITCQATWPLACLSVSSDLIGIKILGHTKYSFRPEQVIGFKKRKGGLQIYHNVDKYPPFILFGILRPTRILAAIDDSGFIPQGQGRMDDVDYKMNRTLTIVGVALLVLFIVLGIAMEIVSK